MSTRWYDLLKGKLAISQYQLFQSMNDNSNCGIVFTGLIFCLCPRTCSVTVYAKAVLNQFWDRGRYSFSFCLRQKIVPRIQVFFHILTLRKYLIYLKIILQLIFYSYNLHCSHGYLYGRLILRSAHFLVLHLCLFSSSFSDPRVSTRGIASNNNNDKDNNNNNNNNNNDDNDNDNNDNDYNNNDDNNNDNNNNNNKKTVTIIY